MWWCSCVAYRCSIDDSTLRPQWLSRSLAPIPVEVARNARLENRLETKDDGRSGALVKLTASPRALLLRRTNLANGTEELCQAPHCQCLLISGAADTNAVRASSQNGFCAHPIARDHS